MLFGRREFEQLAAGCQAPGISIFMPTYKAGQRVEQNLVRFKNLVQKSRQRLSAYRLGSGEIDKLMKPAVRLLEKRRFWRYQQDGLAAFLDRNEFHYYCLPIRVRELLVISTSFHTKPLLPLITSDGRFYILAISLKRIRLFHCTRFSVEFVELPDIPHSLSDILGDKLSEKQLQFHTGAPRRTGGRDARFFGSGGHDQEIKNVIFKYFSRIDKNLQKALKDDRNPLVLAGVDYLLPIFKEASRSHNIVGEGITGNPDRLTADELHEQARNIMQPHFQKAQLDAAAAYQALARSGSRLAVNKLEDVAIAAVEGRVQFLFVTVGVQRWGNYDDKLNAIRQHERFVYGDRDILDLAATHSLLKGGTVYAVTPEKMPDNSEAAAVLRY
jgi:hypothetical protein